MYNDILSVSVLIFLFFFKGEIKLVEYIIQIIYFCEIKTLKKLIIRTERIYINAGK